jgi:hypothetical protein
LSAFSVTITAQDAFNNTFPGFTGTANLTITAGSTVNPSTTGSFTAGEWTGNVTVSGAGAGRVLTATNTNGAETGAGNPFDVQKIGQTITVTAPAPAYAAYNSSFTVAATGGASGQPVTYASSGVCALVGATFTMTSGTGTCTVHFLQAGDDNYNAAPEVTEETTAQKVDETITFPPLSDRAFGETFTVSAIGGGSVNPVTFSIAGGPATATGPNGSAVKVTGVGSITVRASQAGDSNYNDAPDVDRVFYGNKAATVSTILSHLPSPSAVNQPVTVTYSVTALAPGSGAPTGSVAVSSDGGETCTNTVAAGSCIILPTSAGTRTLTAAYAGDRNFTGSSATAAHVVSYQHLLTVSKTGGGTVTAGVSGIEGNGINCGPDCTETYTEGTVVILTPTPSNGSIFSGWSGDPDCADGQVTVNAPMVCTATFNLINTVSIPAATGNGMITLTTESPGCGFYNVSAKTEAQVGSDVSYDYPYGLVGFTLSCATADVTLTFPGMIRRTTYRKYGPTTPGNPATTEWYTFSDVTANSNTSIILHLRDGQMGDDTGVDDIITDQGGPAQEQLLAAIPTLTAWGAMIMALLLLTASIYVLSSRRTDRG